MRLFFLLTILIVFSDLVYGQNWTTMSFNDQVSIDFPSIPDIQEVGTNRVYHIQNGDYIVLALTTDMNAVRNFNITEEKLNAFYKQFINGKLDAATNSKFLGEKIIKSENYEGREIEYTKDFNGSKNIKVTGRIILIDKVIYTFEIWDLTGKGQEDLSKKFFKSINVK